MTSKQMSTLDTFLKSHPTSKECPFTHTRIGDETLKIYGGSYSIDDKYYDTFLDEYFKKVFVDGKHEYMTEKQLVENGPLLVDIDIHYEPSVTQRLHNEDYIMDLIAIYLDKMNKYITAVNDTVINIFVLEKKNVTKLADKTKDGIHIIFGLQVHKAVQVMIREDVVKEISNVWDDLPIVNTWEQVIDEGVTKGHVNWQMYGSRKPGKESYLISTHYTCTYKNNEWSNPTLHKDFDTRKYIKQMCARYTGNPSTVVKEEVMELFEKAKSNLIHRTIRKVVSKIDVNVKNILHTGQFYMIKDEKILDAILEYVLESSRADYKLRETHEYTMALPISYYGSGSYDKWIRVGWALANTHPHLFLSWLKMSCQPEGRHTLSFGGKFDWTRSVEDMYNLWTGFDCAGTDGLSHRSIMYWCKQDAYPKYKDIVKSTLDYYIDRTVYGIPTSSDNYGTIVKEPATEVDLANVLYNIFKDKYVCESIKHKRWYEYVNHRWVEIDSGSTLRIGISKEMYQEYVIRIMEMTNKIQTMEQNDSGYESARKKTYKLTEIAMMLKKTKSKDNIMREACEIFYDKYFLNKLDTNPYLLCFNNGVIDFKENRFRRGQPDDYISYCTNIDYITMKETDQSIVSRIHTFMEELFPNHELKCYMWEHLASTLIGTLDNQTFNIYTGSGRNGKSCLVDLMSKVLGDYKGTVPHTLITQKRTSIGSTSSEVVALRGKRYAVMQEPSKGDRINEGVMKELTGGDPIQGRALFKDVVTFIPQFKLVVTTNVLFDIKSNDDGTWRRIRVCDFKSKFLDTPYQDELHFPKEQYPFQFKLDKKLNECFDTWAPIFATLLVDIAFRTKGNVQDCAIVMTSSNEYREGQDYLAEFAKDKITRSNGNRIQKQELNETFREWYKINYGNGATPHGKELHEYMDRRYGRYRPGGWCDVKIIYDEKDLIEVSEP